MTSGMCNHIAQNTKMSLEIVFGTQKSFASGTAVDSIRFGIRGPPERSKLNFKASVICALNAKTYICHKSCSEHTRTETKLSSKGLSKKTNKLTVDDYLHVLRSKKNLCGLNTGFIRKGNNVHWHTGASFQLCTK